ncbi:hypothetical protein CONLIGDRAFT_686843 [Coniochaeta ligniaria NRRL 30616]|uniref:Uncharacterized protein n=1 Tax=Coniochaeta ligniaria NRRL 30616 TaxID=1408157 RepID=A0A1J7IPM8_9PEZI|nr:hypothetical protein CONLIGDRAFT_686843 [Coniochaeta ligniaria NRRL 30616]
MSIIVGALRMYYTPTRHYKGGQTDVSTNTTTHPLTPSLDSEWRGFQAVVLVVDVPRCAATSCPWMKESCCRTPSTLMSGIVAE